MRYMKRIGLVAGLLFMSATVVQAHDFTAHLSGGNETPSIRTPGQGEFTANISGGTVSFTFSWSDLTTTPTVAHIHFAKTRVAGGVIAFLCGGGGQPACPGGTSGSISGTITGANIQAIPAQGVNAGDFDALTDALNTGDAYVNIHDANFPAGELRGQIKRATDD
jgi:hypothetical protein